MRVLSWPWHLSPQIFDIGTTTRKTAARMLRANAVIVNPQSGCGNCVLQHAKRFETISHATVLSPKDRELLLPHSLHHFVHNEVLLGTANVLIQEPSGNYTECRALIDSGSQVSFISRACAAKLNLDLTRTHLHVEGVAASNVETIHHFTRITLRSFHDPAFNCQAEAYLVPKVTGELPSISFTDGTLIWPHLYFLRLADPEYNLSRDVDLLLGADCFPSIMRSEVRIGTEDQPIAQATAFGWVLLGPVPLKVEVLHPTEPHAEAQGNEDDGRDGENPENISPMSPSTNLFDLSKHSHPGPCWLTKFSLLRTSQAPHLLEDLELD